MRSLKVRCTKNSLLSVQRSTRWKKRMVYILVANNHTNTRAAAFSCHLYRDNGKGAHRPATFQRVVFGCRAIVSSKS
jgi:hypothetical protein